MLKEILLSRLGTLGGGNTWERRRFRGTDGSESLLEGNEGGWLTFSRRLLSFLTFSRRLLSFRVTIVGKQPFS